MRSGETDKTTPDIAPVEPVKPQALWSSNLVIEVRELLRREPSIGAILSIDAEEFGTDAQLLASVLATATLATGDRDAVKSVSAAVFERDSDALDAAMTDIAVTAMKNFEPGGETTTLLFSRGIHALLAHRVTHSLWREGRHDISLALKTVFGRAFATDIHPAARFGRGIWLDHGLGFVVGETTVIGDEVSIWHGVTLGSTLKDKGDQRHPRIGRGATIGADALILGGVDVGEGSVIAAGSIVLADVAAGTTVAGVPARSKPRSANSFVGF